MVTPISTTTTVTKTGDGTWKEFALPFNVYVTDGVKVYLDEVLAVTGTYSVTINRGGNSTVTFSTAPAAGVAVRATRDLPIRRISEYPSNSPVAASMLEADISYVLQVLQDKGRDSLTSAEIANLLANVQTVEATLATATTSSDALQTRVNAIEPTVQFVKTYIAGGGVVTASTQNALNNIIDMVDQVYNSFSQWSLVGTDTPSTARETITECIADITVVKPRPGTTGTMTEKHKRKRLVKSYIDTNLTSELTVPALYTSALKLYYIDTGIEAAALMGAHTYTFEKTSEFNELVRPNELDVGLYDGSIIVYSLSDHWKTNDISFQIIVDYADKDPIPATPATP